MSSYLSICLIFFVVLTTKPKTVSSESDGHLKSDNDIIQRLAALEEETMALKTQLKELTASRCKRQMQLPEEIGFTAKLSSHLRSLGANQPIKFDYVISNIGSAYDNQTGVFIAPVPGTYMFYTTIMSEYSKEFIETEIVKNGAQLVKLYSGDISTGYDTSGNMVIIPLKTGDHVWVKVNGANSNTYAVHGGFSTFSGYLLRLDEGAINPNPVVG